MNVIKEIIDLIVQPLTYITNLSLSSGTVPARVVSLFKTVDISLFTNCRPVSVLPAFSKILERIVYNRLINFLNKFNIFLIINMVLGKITLTTAYALIRLSRLEFFAQFRPRKVSASPQSSSLKFCAAISPARQERKSVRLYRHMREHCY